MSRTEIFDNKDQDDNHLVDESNIITRDEIIKELNLASGAQMGSDGDGSLTKAAITKELTDNISKELEKLRRQSENLQMRKTLIIEGEIHEETEEERNYKIQRDLENEGMTVIHAENERVQGMRHQTGQLGGLGAISMEEVLEMRKLTEERLKVIETEYYKNKDTRFLSSEIRKRLAQNDPEIEADRERRRKAREKETEYDRLEKMANEIREKKKFLASPYNPDRTWVRRIPEMKDGEEVEEDESHLMASAKKETKVVVSEKSQREQVYQAKYTKYKVNKKLKGEYDSGKKQKEDFDLYTKGHESMNVKAKAINWHDLFAQKIKKKETELDDPVFQPDYDQQLLHKLLKKLEKLSKEDRLTFSILKWIFNAIRNKKDNCVHRKELIEQLDQNIDIINSLGFENTEDVAHQLNTLRTKYPGKLTWEEFLDFFCSKTNTFKKTGEMWWKTEKEDGQIFLPTEELEKMKESPETRKSKQLIGAYDRMSKRPDGSTVFADLDTDYKTRENMKKLTESRVNKLVNQEVEKEVKELQRTQRSRSKSNKGDTMHTVSTVDDLGRNPDDEIFAKRPECKLQLSHVEIMKQVFKDTDKYNDGILRRHDFVNALIENKVVQTFLTHDAIKFDRKTKLTVEEVLREFEKDQYIHLPHETEEAKKHKEFTTWEEFLDFFEYYRTPDERMKQIELNEMPPQPRKTKRELEEIRQKQIDAEKERRIRDLPRFREDDKIDADQEYLDIIRNVFDTCDKVSGKFDTVLALELFMALKKDPEMVKINDAIAREPDGKSRIATETFKEVFYRMEASHEEQHIDWSTVLEYFTKRGRPLTLDEIEELKQADLQADDEYEVQVEEQRAEEEQFFRKLREENKDFNATGGSDAFGIETGRVDIEDMEVAVGAGTSDFGRNDFRSTVNSRKKVTFQDTLNERDSNFEVSRPKTAKSTHKFDNVLSRDSLTGADYSEYKKSQKSGTASQRSITVPQPFKFDTRDKIRPKSIRERKVDEMIAEKQLAEDRILAFKFRAKRPPKEVSMPLFDKIMNKNEQRRLEVKENSKKIMKSLDRPFSFYERDLNKPKTQSEYINEEFQKPSFKANKVPTVCTVEIFKVMMDKQNKEREDRIAKNAEVNFRKSRLPPRMEMHEKMRKEKEMESATQMGGTLKRNKSMELGRPLSEIGTFRPPKAKPIPNFEKLQRSFQESLDRKRSSYTPTDPKPFRFDGAKKDKSKVSKTKASLRTYLDEENDPRGFNTTGSKGKRATGTIPNYGKPTINPKSTKKQAALEQRRRLELEEKTKSEMTKIEENKQRYKQQNRLKHTVKEAYAAYDNAAQKDREQKERLKSNKADMIKQEKANKEMIKNMVNKGRSGKLLIERFEDDKIKHLKDNKGYKAIQMVEDVLKKNGLDPQKHLSEDQKDKLADAKFLQKHAR